jgi:glucose 1-dehydrogenase
MNESKMRLVGQTALITGANSGIGYAVAMNMAKEGANIVINYVTNEAAAFAAVESAKLLGNGNNAIALKADVSKEDEVQAMFAEAIKTFGTIDILVNNAGLQKDSPFADMTLAQWQLVIDINLTGQFLCSREAVREFTRRGAVPYSKAIGKIICMSSVHEMIPWAGHANYAASKGGVMLLMKTMAQELGPQKIRINSIGPGAIKTPINTSAWNTPEAEAKLLKLIPLKRVGEPDDIGDVAVFLASEEADYIHGTTIYVDGGMTLFPEFATGG